MEVDFYSVLIITKGGDLKRIYCPIKAICIKDTHGIVSGEIVIIDKVKEQDGKLIYSVKQRYYYYYLFRILDQ